MIEVIDESGIFYQLYEDRVHGYRVLPMGPKDFRLEVLTEAGSIVVGSFAEFDEATENGDSIVLEDELDNQ